MDLGKGDGQLQDRFSMNRPFEGDTQSGASPWRLTVLGKRTVSQESTLALREK